MSGFPYPRRIPSKKLIAERLARALGEGRLPNGEHVPNGAAGVGYLRRLLERWQDREIKTQDMLDGANTLLDAHGVESIMSENERAEAYYVNMGDTYTTTVLLDVRRHAVYITDYGSYVEKEERAGNRFA